MRVDSLEMLFGRYESNIFTCVIKLWVSSIFSLNNVRSVCQSSIHKWCSFSLLKLFRLRVWLGSKVINLILIIVPFFYYTRRIGFTYRHIGFVPFWISKNKKILKCKILKFYLNLHIPGGIWPKILVPPSIWRYRPVQAGI